MIPQRLADLQCASHRRFRAGAKNQRATVACRQTEELAFCFRDAELLGAAYDLLQLLELLALFIDEQLRVTNNVEKKNVPDLAAELRTGLVRHRLFLLSGKSQAKGNPEDRRS